jgi:hypothetical protein
MRTILGADKTICRVASAAAMAILVVGYVGFAQGVNDAPEGVELTGNWVSRSFTEWNTNTHRAFDFLGIPLNDAGHAWTLSHSEEQASEPERQCAFYSSTYFPYGFAPLPMWKETELRTGSTVAWVVGGWLDVVPMVIWMDGRPHPSTYAPHSSSGFTTGVWENDVLTTYTTHMIANLLHRRAPHSDLATMTLHFSRHADILSLTGRIEDPVYLSEPLYVSREWELSSVPVNRAAVPCTVAYEGVPEGTVPHYLPGQNPFVEETTKLWGIPLEAVQGGAETMYPEFRKRIKDKYVRPEKCVANTAELAAGGCGGPGRVAPVIN